MWKNLELCLERGSSPVDWCESNYTFTPLVAEFVNTISNILFFLLPPLLIHLSKQYAKCVNPAINVIWVMMIIVGVSSAYFHATLSLVGQLLDEISILWVMIAAYVSFLPTKLFPRFLRNDRRILGYYAGIFAMISTVLLVMHPWANAFVLMALGIPSILFMLIIIRRMKSRRVFRLGLRTAAVWLLASFCWVLDRLFCDTWLSVNFPYFHGIWHILIFIAGYTALILFAYYHVAEETPEQAPVLKYWPVDSFEFGIAYVAVKYPKRKSSNTPI